jgi:hypothetical protein
MEDSSFQMSLGDLKTAIKEFKKSTPKLTSKKSDLLAFAAKLGLGKKKVEEVKGLEVEKKISKKSEKVAKLPEALPEVLKKVVAKPSKKSEKVEKSVEAPKKKGSPFSAFMAAHKGKGYTMKQMSEMYKEQKV